MCPRILYFLGRGNPLSPTINVFLFRTAWWAACNPSIWEVEVQRLEVSPSYYSASSGSAWGTDLLKTKQKRTTTKLKQYFF